MIRLIRILAAALALALTAAGCGGDGGGNEPFDAQAELDRAFSADGIGAVESGVLDVSFDVNVAGDESGSVNMSLSGPFSEDGETDLDFNLSGSGGGESIDFDGELITTADNAYVGINDEFYELGSERYEQLKASSDTGAETPTDFQAACRTGLQASGADPSACAELQPSGWLTTPTDAGQQSVDGIETNHVSAEVDTRELLTDVFNVASAVVPEEQTGGVSLDAFADQAANFFQDATIDVFVGADDGIPRRAEAAIDGEVADTTVGLDFGLEFSEVNEEQTVEAPPDAQPIESLADQAPAAFQPLIDCFLEAQSAQELNACGASAVPSPAVPSA